MKKMMMAACVTACAIFMVGCGKEKAEVDFTSLTKSLELLWEEACNGSQDAIKVLRECESRCWRQIDSADKNLSSRAEDMLPDNKKGGSERADDNFRYIPGKMMPEALEKV